MISCDVNSCKHNDGNGNCTAEKPFISEAETGYPICETVDYNK